MKSHLRARESVEKHDGLDEAVFTKLQEWLHYSSFVIPSKISMFTKLVERPTRLRPRVFLIQRANGPGRGHGVYRQDLGAPFCSVSSSLFLATSSASSW
jgi:hypothetical protein